MNSKNILIAIGVIGIGLILYKVLLGLVLPIALFVSLGYVLKFLLKGSDDAPGSVEEVSQIITNSEEASSTENIVEIKPIEEDKAVEEEKTINENKAVEKEKAIEENQAVEEEKAIEEDKAVEEDKAL